jgi:hypothetical protein
MMLSMKVREDSFQMVPTSSSNIIKWCLQVRILYTLASLSVTPGFKEQSRVHLIHAPKETTYIITECIEINVTI